MDMVAPLSSPPLEPARQGSSTSHASPAPAMDPQSAISAADLRHLFITFNREGHRGASDALRRVQSRSEALFARDYRVGTVQNGDGDFCSTYPLGIVVPEALALSGAAPLATAASLAPVMHAARFARVRGRLAVGLPYLSRVNSGQG